MYLSLELGRPTDVIIRVVSVSSYTFITCIHVHSLCTHVTFITNVRVYSLRTHVILLLYACMYVVTAHLALSGGRLGLAVERWTQSRRSWVRYCSGASFIKKIHLISPGCLRPNSAFIVQKSGLKHHHFISFHFLALSLHAIMYVVFVLIWYYYCMHLCL